MSPAATLAPASAPAPDVSALTELHAIQALLADTIAQERALDAELEALLAKRVVRGAAGRQRAPRARDTSPSAAGTGGRARTGGCAARCRRRRQAVAQGGALAPLCAREAAGAAAVRGCAAPHRANP
jgi:hypothetical protein